MKSKKVLVSDSENEFDVSEPEEVEDDSEDEWVPTAVAETTGKRGRTAKSTPARKKKKPKVSDDEDGEEKLPKKERGSKAKPPPPAPIRTSARRRATEVLKVVPEEESEDDEEDEEDEDDDEEYKEEEEEYDDDDVEEEEEELNQRPNAKQAKKCTSEAFVVHKFDMVYEDNPPIWKIDRRGILQKYIPFKQDDKVLYKSTLIYSSWGFNNRHQYYLAPASSIQQTNKEEVIEFYKDKIEIDPKVEEAAKREFKQEEDELEEEEAKLANDDDDDDDDDDDNDEKE